MGRLLLILAILAPLAADDAGPVDVPSTCYGNRPCTACRDCSRCNYCHRLGGYCGVCSRPHPEGR